MTCITNILFLLSFWVATGFATTNPILSNYRVGADANLVAITDRFEIHRRTQRGYEVYVPAENVRELFNLAPRAELLQFDIKTENLAEFRRSRAWRSGYHSFSQVEQILKNYSVANAAIASLIQYGTSTQGRPLYALRVRGISEDRPQIMMTAATHGDELITVEVLLGIMERIIAGYSKETRIKDIVDSHDIFFVPVVNPDGFYSQDRYDNGRDPNRSYPWPENSVNSPTGSITPLIRFFQERRFVASIDFHASGELIMYPWAYTYSSPAAQDETQFRLVGDKMAHHNDYAVGQISKIIYIAKGSSADYYYWKKKSISYGIEMAKSKVPHSNEIASVLRDNMESTLDFIEHF